MSQQSPVIDQTTAPAPGTYALDAGHNETAFRVRHLGVGRVRGRFTSVHGTIVVADDPRQSSVDVTIEAASIESGESQRDEHLRSADFLDTESHPTITYRSSRVGELDEDGGFTVEGELNIRGITRPVTLSATYEGEVADPWGNTRFGYTARAEVNREDFGLTWNQALEAGGVLVGRKVAIELEGEAIRQS